MKSSSQSFTVITVILGIIILIVLAVYLINIKAVPSLGDFIASSTEQLKSGTTTAEVQPVQTPEISETASSSMMVIHIIAPHGTIRAFVATSSVDQEKGLGDLASLPKDEGMLFPFATPGIYSFWMKDMQFPLDMVWTDSTKTVVAISRDVKPESYPDTFAPPSPVSFVIELNAGEAQKLGIATGTMLKF